LTEMYPSLRCLVAGHEDRVQHQRGRMFLECAECGRVTSGWTLREMPAKPAAGDSYSWPARMRDALRTWRTWSAPGFRPPGRAER
jgi:hypothetical protein